MRDIRFNVNQQRIQNEDSVAFVYKGSHNYINLIFNFNKDWEGCVKGIVYVVGAKEKAYLLKDDSHVVPAEAFDEKELVFYLVGKTKDYRIESQKFTIKLKLD